MREIRATAPDDESPADSRLFVNPFYWLDGVRMSLLWMLYCALIYPIAWIQKIFFGEGPPTIGSTVDFSPDGRLMVFNGVGRGGSDLFLLDVASLKVRRLTDSDEEESWPRFSPDGTQIVYSSGLPGYEKDYLPPRHIYLYNLIDDTTEQLTFETGRWDYSPSFSSDGMSVAFDGMVPESVGSCVCVVDVKSKESRQLTHANYNCMLRPRFWRNDTEVLFTAYTHAEDELGSYAASVAVSGDSPEPIPITPFGYTTSCVYPLSDNTILLVADDKGDLRYRLSIFDCRTREFRRLPKGGGVPSDPVAVGTMHYWFAGVDGLYCLDTSLGDAAVPFPAFDRSLFDRPTDWSDGPPKTSRSQHPQN